MKKSIYVFLAVMAIIFASCSKNGDSHLTQSRSASSQVNYADFGMLHNILLDAAFQYISVHPDVMYVEGENNIRLIEMHEHLKAQLPIAIANSSISQFEREICEAMDNHFDYYGWEETDLYLNDEMDSPAEIAEPCQIDYIAQLDSLNIVSSQEINLLRKLWALLPINNIQKSDTQLRSELELLLYEWRSIYGSETTASYEDGNALSGITLQIAIYSCDWWISHKSQLHNCAALKPQYLGPVGVFIVRDACCALVSGAISMIRTWDNIDWRGVGWDALSGGLGGSVGGLGFRFRK